MISPFNRSSDEMPNIGIVFAHKREYFETYQANLHATDLSNYRNYSLREVLEFINDFDELARHASDTHGILDRSGNLTPIEKLRFQNELRRICDLTESVMADLNHILDHICSGRKNPRVFKKIEPNILLLRRLIDRVVGRLDLIIDQEVTFD